VSNKEKKSRFDALTRRQKAVNISHLFIKKSLKSSVADPKQKFRIRIQIRIQDSDPDKKLAKTSFFVLKFLPSLIFKHKKAAFPQLHDLAQ
jgi:hypothetical protein